ncbi:MAG: phosphate transporter, ATPase subunit [Acidimicrobiaceae bacterium]|jgi:phosphate transport system ATP-binding protein|nr:phosphate transporter, ATPase subunit [Acidimicrobiaceae bacterium]
MEIEVRQVSAWFDDQLVLEDVSFTVPSLSVTALIGPSGSGKSTLLRVINRMHEETRGSRLEGQVLLDGEEIYAPRVDPATLRRSAGMVFQAPNPFPNMTILENASSGLAFNGVRKRSVLEHAAERVLRLVGLWEEIPDRLRRPAVGLSGGQQQRLCIARAIAVEPDVLLMDEPCSALDPISTLAIEALLKELSATYTIIVVTHDLQQAARVSDSTVFLSNNRAGGPGRVIEVSPTVKLFTEPKDARTEAYLTGRLG